MKRSKGIGILIAAVLAALACFALVACNTAQKPGLELDTANVQTVFGVNETFSSKGLVVTAVIDDERYIVPLNECEITAPDMSTEGEKTVKVSFMNATAEYKITIVPVDITGISLETANVKTGYVKGDEFSYDGLVVTATYSYGEPRKVSLSDCAFSGFDGNTVGEQTVTVSYSGMIATYKITVVSNDMIGITVDYTDAVREYVVDVPFSYDGLKVLALYDGGVTKPIGDDEYTVSQPDMSTIGVKTVTVTYKSNTSMTASYQVYAIPDVVWDTNRLIFGNESNTSDTLDLFVTNIEGGGWEGWGNRADTTGWYLLKRADGTYSMYEFSFTYVPQNDPQCEFKTAGLDAEYLDNSRGGDMFVEIGELTFRAGASLWHNRIMGWMP